MSATAIALSALALSQATNAAISADNAEHAARCGAIINTMPSTVSQKQEYAACVGYLYPQTSTHFLSALAMLAVICAAIYIYYFRTRITL